MKALASLLPPGEAWRGELAPDVFGIVVVGEGYGHWANALKINASLANTDMIL